MSEQIARVSLKTKILVGLCGLLLLTLSANLLYTNHLFTSDKRSYVFDTTLKKAENLSDEIAFRIKTLKKTGQIVAQSFDKPEQDIKEIFKDNKELVWAALSKNNKSQVAKEIVFNPEYQDFTNLLQLSVQTNNYKSPFWIFKKNQNYLAITRFDVLNGQEAVWIALDVSSLFRELIRDNTFKNVLIWKNPNGENIYIGSDQFKSFAQKALKAKFIKGAEQIKVNEDEYLSAFVQKKAENFVFISSTESKNVFNITKSLIIKTTLFALSVLGLFIAIGIIFSSTLTTPILKLTHSAQKVARGDFNIEQKIESNDEIGILSNSFMIMSKEIQALLATKEDMILQLADANAKLEDYSKNLEKMVEQRTRELKQAHDFMNAMINSLDQGLVVFDQELKCNDVYTNATKNIFEKDPKGLSYPELLELPADESTTLKEWANITFSEMLPFESAIGLAPQERKWGTNFHEENFKSVSLQYFPMRDDDGKLMNIVAVGTDKTKEIQATEYFNEKEKYVSMILKILGNKTQFSSFINEVHSIFSQFKNCYEEESNALNLELSMMLLHTLNGGFGLYSLYELQQKARSYEDEISDAKNSSELLSTLPEKLNQMVSTLKSNFQKQLQELDAALGTSFSSGIQKIEVSKDEISKLQKALEQISTQLPTEFKDSFYQVLIKEPIVDYFKAYNDLALQAAEKLGKELNPIEFRNGNLKIDPRPYLELFNVLIHLFRNCVDHGIEAPYLREERSKPSKGTISVEFRQQGHLLTIDVQDDGAGINSEKIRNKLISLYPEQDFSHLSEKDLQYKIFDPFLSTRDEVSALSGRGVGMSAIKEVVEKLNGTIELESELGKGSRFIIQVPLQLS